LRELLTKLPTPDQLLACTPSQLDGILLEAIGDRVRRSQQDPIAPRNISLSELQGMYPIGAGVTFEQRSKADVAVTESWQRLMNGGFLMEAIGQARGVMTLTSKGLEASIPNTRLAGQGTVTRDSTNAAIVIAVLPFKKSADNPPVEIAEAERIAQWLVDADGGRVPERNLQRVMSKVGPNHDVIGPDSSEIEAALRQLYDVRAPRTRGSLVTNRLYIVVIGPGFGDREGRVTLLLNAHPDARISGIELTGIANQFRDERLFDEVVLVADVPRLPGHQGSSSELKFGTRVPSLSVQPAAYWYAFSNRFGARQSAEPQTKRFVSTLLRGLNGEGADPHDTVDSHSLAQYLEREYQAEKDSIMRPEFRSDRGPPIVLSRPPLIGRASIMEGSDTVTGQAESLPRPTVEDTRIEPATAALGIASEAPSIGLASAAGAAVRGLLGGGLKFAREAGEDELSLNVDDYANAVAQLYASADAGEFCLAVFGPWGRGKTFLMRRVDRALLALNPGYRKITFSAWKYPSAPEVWVHLYEEFAKIAFEGPWYQVMPNVIRAGMVKHGDGPLLWAYALFAFGLIPVGTLLGAAHTVIATIYPIIGVIGFVLLATIFTGVRRTKARLSHEYLTGSRHTEKLGLQATIGSDLRALLMGWIPIGLFRRSFTIWYAVITAALISAVMLRLAQGAELENLAQKYFSWTLVGKTQVGVEIGLDLAIAGFFWRLLRWLVTGGASPRRILLVVDDLDRCKPEHLLSVMESIKLLIEDPEISRRVQVAMLLEEDILKHAIFKKYGHLTDQKTANLLHTHYDAERLIWENGEKLFTAHLRLPILAKSELLDLIATFSRRKVDEAAEQKQRAARRSHLEQELEKERRRGPLAQVHTGTNERQVETGPMVRGERVGIKTIREEKYRDATPDEIEQHRKRGEERVQELEAELRGIPVESYAAAPPPVTSVPPPATGKVLERSEIDAILKALDTQTVTRTTLGPRAIRAFIFRYQLARLLLNTLRIEWAPDTLANSLAAKSFGAAAAPAVQPVSADLSDAEKLQRVVDQVC
jgi:KAP-like P-loop domain-containing protein